MLEHKLKIKEIDGLVDDLVLTNTGKSIDGNLEDYAHLLFPQEGETTPRLRFKGFEGEWEKKTIGDICYSQPSSITQESLSELNGDYPIYGASGFIKNIDSYEQDQPYVGIVKDGSGVGRVGIYPAYSSILGTMHYVLPRDGYDIYFIAFLLESIDLTKFSSGSTIPHIYYKDYKEIEVLIPSIEEQKKIALFFLSLNNEMNLLLQRYDQLKEIKLACLDGMFPQGDKLTPSIRFKGFNGDWVKVLMSDIFTERHEVSTITDELPQLSFTIEEGVIKPENRKSNKRDFLIKDKINKKYLITRVDDIIYNPANVIYGAIHKNGLCDGVVSPIYKIFSTEQDSAFMECIVRHPSFIQGMTVFMEGTVQKLKTLKPESFLQMSAIIAPTIEEQKLIGSFFSRIELDIITREQQLERLKQMKSACLRSMFPSSGGGILPLIRFKGFEGEWIPTILSMIVNRYDNMRIPIKESERLKGSTPYYGANGIQDYVHGYTHDGEFLLVAEDGANNLEEYPVQYVNGKVWVNNHAHVIAAKENICSTSFLQYAISCADVKSVLVGGTRAKLTSNALMNLTVLIPPTIEEQSSIASFLRSLDEKISIQTQQIEKLKQLKSACLDKMIA